MAPAQTEGMPGRVGVHPVAMAGIGIVCILEESCAQFHGTTMRRIRVGYVKVDVRLLRFPIWPIGRNVARCVLHTENPVAFGVDDWVETRIVAQDNPVEHGSPELTLSFNVFGIEHNNVTDSLHGCMLSTDLGEDARRWFSWVEEHAPWADVTRGLE